MLLGIIESFVNREGTDYGEFELSLDEKTKNLMAQVENGQILVVYDETSQSVSLLPKYDVFTEDRSLISLPSFLLSLYKYKNSNGNRLSLSCRV